MNGEVRTLNNVDMHTIALNKRVVYFILKRTFDIVCAFIGCLLLMPITLFVKIAYLLSGDFNSIFYSQERIGKYGDRFLLYKFRTMVPNADEILEKILKEDRGLAEEYRINKKMVHDPRITKVGRFLRISSLDELPQMINVLFGDMSLIGNRPYLPRERMDMGYYYKDITKTKPGITGYWQVSGRSDVTFKKRLELERYYSNHYSLKMDMQIFINTFKIVFLRKGAK